MPLRVSAMQVIGFRSTDEGEWASLRSLQYRDLHKGSLIRTAAHGIAAIILVGILFGKVPSIFLGGWMLAVFVAIFHASKIERALANIDQRKMTRSEYRRQGWAMATLAAIWSVPILGFVPFGSMADHLTIWAVTIMLIAGTSVLLAQVPMATLSFAGIGGTAASLSFAYSGHYGLAALTIVFCAMMVVGVLESSKVFLTARIAEMGVAEKDEVVSLLLREFEENEADWLWQVDPQRCVKAASPRFAFALGSEPAKVEGKRLIELIAGPNWNTGKSPPSLHELADRLKRRESFSNLVVEVDLGQEHRWWELSGTPIFDERGNFAGFRGVGSDVTEQRESSEKIAYLARYDTLTGLPNRLMLTEALNEALRYAEQWRTRCALLMIDLDRFKAVNDSLGHHVGDKLLAQVSKRLHAAMTDNEQVGRLGGDEFAVVIRDAERPGYIGEVADRIIRSLSAPYAVDDHTLYIGASVGSAVGPRDGVNVETLMRNADLALYRAKDEGGGEHCRFQPALHTHAQERLKLEASLRRAIENNELELHYQPVVNAMTESVGSFEALLRWNSREHGSVSPAKFIPLAEDTRLIVPIGEWVLRTACREATMWPDEIRVAVNVSGEQIVEPNFIKTIVRALAETGLAARRLEIEVTESVFLRDDRLARQVLEQILALGCTLALDDFGTGYSSLGYLRTMRFSTIKVDRSFVQGAALQQAESLAIINAVVAMATSLNIYTTAEGVEDEAQAQLVRELGCTKIQGYYFGRPMPANEARTLVVRSQNSAVA